MPTESDASKRAAGRRKRSKAAAILPEEVIERTDQLAEVSDHCGAAKRLAEEMGETFLAYLLSMAIQEARTSMRLATMGMVPPARKRRPAKSAS